MALQQIDQVERRVRSYWYQDGLAELATGGVFVLLGAYFGLQGYFGEESTLAVILQVGLALLLILGAYFVRKIVNSLKMRLTYPRTGYVQYHVDARQVRWQRYATAALGLAIAALLVVVYSYVPGLDLVVLATGVLVAFIWIALRTRAAGIKRFFAHAATALLLGTVLSTSRLPQGYGLALFYVLQGLELMAVGGWMLHGYLRENPSPAKAQYGG